MTRIMIALGAIAISVLGFMPADSKAASMSPLTSDMIFIGCSVPPAGTAGMTVYSFEAFGGNGKWIPTELGDTKEAAEKNIGKSCSAILNRVIGTTKGCPDYNAWQPVIDPSFNALSNTGYGLNLFMLMCSYYSQG